MTYFKIKNQKCLLCYSKNNIFVFIRETEYKHIIKDKTYAEKISDFIECYNLINKFSDVNFNNYDYIDESNINDINNSEEEYINLE